MPSSISDADFLITQPSSGASLWQDVYTTPVMSRSGVTSSRLLRVVRVGRVAVHVDARHRCERVDRVAGRGRPRPAQLVAVSRHGRQERDR